MGVICATNLLLQIITGYKKLCTEVTHVHTYIHFTSVTTAVKLQQVGSTLNSFK